MAVAVLGHGYSARAWLHVKVAANGAIDGFADFETNLAPMVGEHEVGDSQQTFRAAHVRPLLQFGDKRTVESRRDASIEQQLAREFRRHRRRAVFAPLL